mgnify:FL=1
MFCNDPIKRRLRFLPRGGKMLARAGFPLSNTFFAHGNSREIALKTVRLQVISVENKEPE